MGLSSKRLQRACLRLCVSAGVALLAAPAFAGEIDVSVKDTAGRPLAEAVVFAENLGGAARPAAAVHATIDQVNKEFVPLVTVLQVGTEVSFPNSDNIRHSIYSFSSAKTFTTKLYSGRQAAPLIFDKPGLVVLGCNIHDRMVAWVVVVDTPFFGKSGADGGSVLRGLEAGDYRLSVWYPQSEFSPHVEQLHVGADAVEQRTVTLDASSSPLPAVQARVKAGP
jgi:plastocyanin